MATIPPAAPGRIVTLDVIRGIAVMGIFSVNVIAFAMIEPAYLNPSAFGGHHGASLAVWFANYVLIDGKMRALFSMLFGASMLLVIDRAEASGQSGAAVHYRRMVVLLLFGLIHYYVIWHGDILTLYALVGMVAFLFHRANLAALLATATTLMLATTLMFSFGATQMRKADVAAHSSAASAKDVRRWNDNIGFLVSIPADAKAETRLARSPLPVRAADAVEQHAADPFSDAMILAFPTLALMLFGMAGYRSGFLTGDWPLATYRRIAVRALGIGGLLTAALALLIVQSHFYVVLIFFAFIALGGFIQLAMAFGYAALIILLARRGGSLSVRLGAVGRAAFSNYLGTSILAALIFYGDGLALFGKLTRVEAWLLVPLFWALMLAWSKPWLDRFNYGPLEWAWRSLARWRLQPMRRVLDPAEVLVGNLPPEPRRPA